MTYLSRLLLNPLNRTVQGDLANCHQLHRHILQAFPAAPVQEHAREYFGVLYRLEELEAEPSLLRLLVQSAAAPDWNRLPAGYLGVATDGTPNPAVRTVDAEYARIQAGMHLRFRLRANPTRRVSAKLRLKPSNGMANG